MIKYYPINLVLENKKCVVVGAGKVAERKVKCLLECGALVSVISPEISSGLQVLLEKKKITFIKRKVNLKDLNGAYLVIIATDDRKLNADVSSFCLKKGLLVNTVDSPQECNFILPAILNRGDLTISVSTNGLSPALARKIRQDLERMYGSEYAQILRLLKEIRPRALKKIKKLSARKAFFQKAIQPRILVLLKQNKKQKAKQKLEMYLKNAQL